MPLAPRGRSARATSCTCATFSARPRTRGSRTSSRPSSPGAPAKRPRCLKRHAGSVDGPGGRRRRRRGPRRGRAARPAGGPGRAGARPPRPPSRPPRRPSCGRPAGGRSPRRRAGPRRAPARRRPRTATCRTSTPTARAAGLDAQPDRRDRVDDRARGDAERAALEDGRAVGGVDLDVLDGRHTHPAARVEERRRRPGDLERAGEAVDRDRRRRPSSHSFSISSGKPEMWSGCSCVSTTASTVRRAKPAREKPLHGVAAAVDEEKRAAVTRRPASSSCGRARCGRSRCRESGRSSRRRSGAAGYRRARRQLRAI